MCSSDLRIIDDEVTRILNEAADRATTLLTENRAKLDALAGELENREMLDDTEVVAIVGPAVPRRPGEAGAQPQSTAPVQAARGSQPG